MPQLSVTDRSPNLGTGIMFMKDHCGVLSHCISTLLQKLRQMSSKSQHLKTSGGILPSGPVLLLSLSDVFTFLNSSRVMDYHLYLNPHTLLVLSRLVLLLLVYCPETY